MRLPAWIMALAIGACAFSSDAPLFAAGEAAFPIADGARYDWVEPFPSGERFDVIFRRVEGGYEMIEAEHADEPMRVRFVAIAETPEDDYVVQADLSPDSDGYAYAYAWRADEVFRIVADPGTVEPGPKRIQNVDAYCEWLSYSECKLESADEVLAVYRAVIYPRFVTGGDLPGRYTELVPIARRLPPGTRK
jgi:hypothetical protein